MDRSFISLDVQGRPQEELVHNKRKRDPNEDGANQLLTYLTVPSLPETNNTVDVQKLLDVLQSFQGKTNTESDTSSWSRSKRSRTDNAVSTTQSPQTKPPKNPSALPESLWQRIFGHVPPVFLGRLMRVCRSFNTYLTTKTGSQMESFSPLSHNMEPTAAEQVWIASRKRFCPGLPKPLHGLRELDMWRLLRGSRCQLCDKYKRHVYTSELPNSWEMSPERDGLRFVWPFGIRCCIPCLRKSCEKELTLRISPALNFPKDVMPALPFVFMTSDDHYLNIAALGDTERPPFLQFDKVYYKPHIEAIKTYFEEVKALGEGSTEEWLKGLPSRGDALLTDYSRFENWELKGGLKKVNARNPSRSNTSDALRVGQKPYETIHLDTTSPMETDEHGHPKADHRIGHNPKDLSHSKVLEHGQPTPQGHAVSLSSSPIQPNFDGATLTQSYNRQGRSIGDINEVRESRKAEIERRCATLSPPLRPKDLIQMDSFKAAMQIPQPMTDSAWDVLKPRLLAQRPVQDQRRQMEDSQDRPTQDELRESPGEVRDPPIKDWDAYQTHVRDQIGAIADDYIVNRWARGKRVTKETAPRFAAELLDHVREIFYDQSDLQDQPTRTAGKIIERDRAGEPSRRTLTLENMKWIHDNKIKPRTDRFQSELFQCAGCPGNSKLYGFEGVVQHYAAKHTSSLSQGNSVVHWRAEWPEEPIYNPDPGTARAPIYQIPIPLANTLPHPPPRENFPQETFTNFADSTNGHVTFSQSGPPPYQPVHPVHQGENNYHHTQTNSYRHLSESMRPFEHGYGGPPPQVNGYMPPSNYTNHPPGPYSHPEYAAGYQAPWYPSPAPVPFGPLPNQYLSNTMPHQVPPPYGGPGENRSGYYHPPGPPAQCPQNFHHQGRPPAGSVAQPRPSPHSHDIELYKRQSDEMARHAREVWFASAGVKDMPQSVRIFIVIHHMSRRFEAEFNTDATLIMFQDGLNNNARMRPVRSLNGLGCNACVAARREAEMGQKPAVPLGIGDRRLFTLPLLLNHFRNHHIEPALANGVSAVPNWKTEMVELPESKVITELVHAIGMDDAKLALSAAAFPGAFPTPLPRVDSSSSTGPIPNLNGDVGSAMMMGQRSGHQLLDGHVAGHDARNLSIERSRVMAQAANNIPASAASREDEYDPHRPANLQAIIKSEPISARYGNQTDQALAPDPLQELSRNLGSYQAEYRRSHSSLAPKDDDFPRHLDETQCPHNKLNDPQSKHRSYTQGQALSATSPTQAAERFLQDLPLRNELDRLASGTVPLSWRDGPRDAQSEKSTVKQVKVEHAAKARERGFSHPPDDNQAYSPATTLNDGQQDDEYRPSSRIEAPSISLKSNNVSPQRAVYYNPQTELEYRREPTEVKYISDVYRRRDSPLHDTHASAFRDKSRSPRSNHLIERTSMEPRTRDDHRQEPYYRVLSPPPREDTRSQRLVRYDYGPADRYAYMDERVPPEPAIRPRIQYIPVEVERPRPTEQGRYVYTQPIESGPRPKEYVRYEGGFEGDSVYERGGQLYRAQAAHDSLAYPRTYKY